MFPSKSELAALGQRVRRLERMIDLIAVKLEIAPDELAGGAQHGISPEVAELAAAGKKIQAIKLLREQTGWGLAEAKRAVDDL
jgi:large subunit ribosomal protein L7/L12